jgi:hypothetical protein
MMDADGLQGGVHADGKDEKRVARDDAGGSGAAGLQDRQDADGRRACRCRSQDGVQPRRQGGGAKIQIGPALRGSALRDVLDFVNFNEFKNQIEWAQFGKAFNEKVNGSVLQSLPRDGLAGKTVKVTGAFTMPASGQLPLVTPATLTLGQ